GRPPSSLSLPASHGWCHLHLRERGSPMKNRKREICTSGSVRDEDGQPPHLLGRRAFLHLTSRRCRAAGQSGKVRALAGTTATRSEALPEVPTIGETISGFEASTWQGIGAPKGTPDEIVVTLNKEINAALADETIKARLAELGSVAMPMSPAEFEKIVVEETEKWAKVIRAANIKAD